MTNALTIYKDFDGLQRAAVALFKSGYFEDAKSEAQAIVKVMAGAEVGIPPFASMAGINIIQGKPTFGSNLIATIVDNHPRYAYKVMRADDEACVIEWYKDGELAGDSSFTIEEAHSIKQWNSKKKVFEPLTNKFNWQNWTSDMLFARAMTRGQKRYAAGAAGGAPMYTAEEMGVDEDGQGFIDANFSEVKEEKPPAKKKTKSTTTKRNNEILDEIGYETEQEEVDLKSLKRPYTAEQLKMVLEHNASLKPDYDASDKQRNLLGSLLSEHFQDKTKRYEASEWLFGARSTKDIDGAMVKTALDWLKPTKDEGGAYVIDANAVKELDAARTAALKASGQESLI